ncbi:MAG: reverse transcriptase domain-containing protein, partial [Candidatus Thiodiazotropha sp.]
MDDNVSQNFVCLKNKPENFCAGKISKFFQNWTKLTKDRFILNVIKEGYEIEFESEPCSNCNRKPINFNAKEQDIISDLLRKFENKGVIIESEHEPGEILSNIFIRPKQDGSYRLILNLSRLNEHVDKITFKMETLRSALQMIHEGCFFAKIDLKDAFYSVSIKDTFRKYLKFEWQGKLYEFTCLPNGLSTASRIFTKVMKPVFGTLRKMGHENVAYIDDSLLQGDTYEQCMTNIQDTMKLIDSLGLTTHPEKSIIVPTQSIEFVGFLLNSVDMSVRLAPRKVINLIELARKILQAHEVTIREFSKLIGTMVAAEPGVKYAALYYKTLELDRDRALKLSARNFDANMCISIESVECIKWWIENLHHESRPISLAPMDRRIETDSSRFGYGGHDVTHDLEFSGLWTEKDKVYHINYLELKAAFLCLQFFCRDVTHEHIYLFMDNTVALKYVTKMGGRKPLLNKLAKQIWKWCEDRDIWISAFHIPGRLNVRADRLSRMKKKCNEDMEWALAQNIYDKIVLKMGTSDIDLFASKQNSKNQVFISYIPEKGAFAVNAFSVTWNYNLHYAFPPFSIIGRVIQKMCQDKAEVILVAPLFPSQPWFPTMLRQISGQSYVLPKSDSILYLPGTLKRHKLKKMRLGAFRLSGNASSVRAYQCK